jgi:hypothetical protein
MDRLLHGFIDFPPQIFIVIEPLSVQHNLSECDQLFQCIGEHDGKVHKGRYRMRNKSLEQTLMNRMKARFGGPMAPEEHI